jgi:8-oxo-dGTP pyrophosphatase MutT (NUDIX family)
MDANTDQRINALALLRRHAAKGLDAYEAAMVADTIAFVEAHEDCLLRTCAPGHLTGSAWIVDATRTRTLLTHHRKLDKWLQLGGHADGDPDLLAVAFREANEESGLTRVRAVSVEPFDVDRHRIPARGSEPEHFHYDLRFMIEADRAEALTVTSESKDLAWVEVAQVTALNPEESMARMVRKTLAPGIDLSSRS